MLDPLKLSWGLRTERPREAFTTSNACRVPSPEFTSTPAQSILNTRYLGGNAERPRPTGRAKGPVSRRGQDSWLFSYYLPRKPMNVVAALNEHANSMMAVKYGSIRPSLERASLPRRMGRFQFAGERRRKSSSFALASYGIVLMENRRPYCRPRTAGATASEPFLPWMISPPRSPPRDARARRGRVRQVASRVTYLLDTNAISDQMRAGPRVENRMASLDHRVTSEGSRWMKTTSAAKINPFDAIDR
jgi:hypothetical protein